VTLTGTKDTTVYPANGDAELVATVVGYFNTLSIEDDVLYLQISSQCVAEVPGLLTLTVGLAFDGGTPSQQNLTIGDTEKAIVSEANITVSIV